MSSEDKAAKVWVGGKLITLSELQQKYEAVSLTGEKTESRIITFLAVAEKPLTRRDIANGVKVTTGYATQILKALIKKGYVFEFDVKGSNYKYYVLTEKGYSISKSFGK